MHRVTTRVVCGVLFLFVGACGGAESPVEVAHDFWQAIGSGDRSAAAAFVTRESLVWIDNPSIPVGSGPPHFGEPLQNDSAAIVRTSFSAAEGDSEPISFNTHLVVEDGRWKVDLLATRDDAARSRFVAGVERLGEAIGQGFEQLGQALERGVEQVRDALDDALDETDREP